MHIEISLFLNVNTFYLLKKDLNTRKVLFGNKDIKSLL